MSTPLKESEIAIALDGLPGWTFANDRISKTYKFPDFRRAIAFIVSISFDAEELDHHPEVSNLYNRVTIVLNTHDAGGKVTAKDIVLAGKIERIGGYQRSFSALC
jgi:4a-hydroxytetrahydrobiopterin dehydratase